MGVWKNIILLFISNKEILLFFLGAIIISYLVWGYLFSPGCIILGDIDFGFYNTHYLNRLTPLWNEGRSTNNFFNLPRLFFVLPLYIITEYIQPNSCLILKIMIFILYIVGVVGIACLTKNLIEHYNIHVGSQKNSQVYLLISCFFAGIIYMYCPYSIHRIHHFYLIVGYAFFPRVLLGYKRYIFSCFQNNKITPYIDFSTLLFSTICLVLASGGIHYMFYMILGSSLIIGIYAFLLGLQKRRKQCIQLCLAHSLRIGVFFVLFSFRLLPFLHAKTLGDFTPKNINVYDTIAMFSRNADIVGVLKSDGYWRPLISTYQIQKISPYLSMIKNKSWLILRSLMSVGLLRCILYHRRLGIFLTISGCLLLILSTGTYYHIFAKVYIWFVFHAPGAGILGTMFRDSNKFVGLLFLILAVCMGIGCYVLFHHLTYISRIHNSIWRKKFETTRGKKQIFVAESILIIILCMSIIGAYGPYCIAYRQALYNLVAEPKIYSDIRTYIDKTNTSTGKTLYMPRYERVNSPAIGFSKTFWNTGSDSIGVSKPTGSADIYSFPYPTYHPLEGNINGIAYIYDFIEEILSKGIIQNFGGMIHGLGVQQLIFHNDIVGYTEKADAMIRTLGSQKDLQSNLISSGTYIYTPTNTGFLHSGNAILNFGGLKNQLGFNEFLLRKNPNAQISPHIFVMQSFINQKNLSHSLVDSALDYQLSISTGERIGFGENALSANPFVKWAKSRLDSQDWIYYIRKFFLENYNRGFDYDKGIVYTMSPRSITIPSYIQTSKYGDVYFDSNKFNDISQFFSVGDDVNESNIKLVLDQKTKTDMRHGLKGGIVKGDSPIWRIGMMKPLPIKEKNGYNFSLAVSGKGVNKLHAKIKFFDINFNEIGIGYLGAPDNVTDIEYLKLEGSFIAPPQASFMMFQLSSLENPKEQSYRRIHNLVIKDLHEYMIDNAIQVNSQQIYTGVVDIYARIFFSQAGGALKISLQNNINQTLITKTTTQNEWKRIKLFTLNNPGKVTAQVTNLSGFNALNILQIEQAHTVLPFLGQQVIYKEAEQSAQQNIGVQPERWYQNYLNGRSLNGYSGTIRDTFDVLTGGLYTFYTVPNITGKGFITQTLLKADKIISSSFISSSKINSIQLPHIQTGTYTLLYDLKTKDNTMIDTSDIKTLDKVSDVIKQEIYIKEDIATTEKREKFSLFQPAFNTIIPKKNTLKDEKGCSYYYDWSIKNDVKMTYNDNSTKIMFATGYGCQRLIASHERVPITGDHEYFIGFGITKRNTKKLHIKIQYYNQQGDIIPTSGLLIEKDQMIANHLVDFDFLVSDGKEKYIQHVITTPVGAAYMKFEIWQKQRQDFPSITILSDLKIFDYLTLPGIDAYSLIPKDIDDKNNSKQEKRITVYKKVFSPLWQSLEMGATPYICNGFLYCLQGVSYVNNIRYNGNVGVYIGYILGILLIICMLFLIKRGKNKRFIKRAIMQLLLLTIYIVFFRH